MQIVKKLLELGLDPDTAATLHYSEGADVFVHNETEIETALEETDVVQTLSALLAEPGGLTVTTTFGIHILEELRSSGLLDDYERGSECFEDFLAEVLTENFYEFDFIETEVKRYDHKRGFCTLSAEVKVPIGEIIEKYPYIGSWTVSVPTENGTLTLD